MRSPTAASSKTRRCSRACERARHSPRGRLHLLGLVSDGGVHSGWEHIEAAIELATQEGVPDLVFHAFTDGRDTLPHGGPSTSPSSSAGCTARAASGRCAAATTRWTATRAGSGPSSPTTRSSTARACAPESAAEAVAAAYDRGETDEFVKPTVIGGYDGAAPGDVAIFLNFRPDRARQLTRALAEPGFEEFSRSGGPILDLTTMTEYRKGWPYPVAFRRGTADDDTRRGDRRGRRCASSTSPRPRSTPTSPTSSTAAARRSGTGRSAAWSHSPRDVPTYDHRPEMSARAAADAFVERWSSGDYRFGIINFANPDMVGHTGVIPAAIAAVETVDGCLGEVVAAVGAGGGACIVTADHGNCDHMLEPDGSPNTAHSLNPVPLIVTAGGLELRSQGILADVAPTALELLGFPSRSR